MSRNITNVTDAHSFNPWSYRAIVLILFSMLSLAVTQCSPKNEIVTTTELATTCGDFEHPARRITYSGSPKEKHDVLLDDKGIRETILFLGSEHGYAGEAHQYAGDVDIFFRQLAKDGYGSWSGCYLEDAAKGPIMPSYVSAIPADRKVSSSPANNSDKNYGVIYWDVNYGGIPITKGMVAHEWTHSVVNRTIKLWSQGGQNGQPYPGQSGALYEALGDIFAFFITGNKVERATAVTTMDKYAMLGTEICPIDPDDENKRNGQKANLCKYVNMGIPKQATYLMIDSGLSRDKLARIYFHALNPEDINAEVDFEDFALEIEKACRKIVENPNLANQNDANGKSFKISESDCEQTKMAFCAVGILTGPTCTPQINIYTVSSTQPWQTMLSVRNGQNLEISYISGNWRVDPNWSYVGAEGYPSTNFSRAVLRGANDGGLIGRIGNGEPFFVGNHLTIYATQTGYLQLRMNDGDIDLANNTGSLIIQVIVY